MESPRYGSHSPEAPTALLETSRTSAEPSVRLMIYTSRVLMGSIVFMVALALINLLMIDGFTFDTIQSTNLSDDDKSDMLDKYNTYSGSIASIVSLPFQRFAVTLLPIFFLCFTTKAVLSEDKSFVAQWSPALVIVVVGWVLNQGLNALNVQFDSPQVEYIIGSNDLSSSDAASYLNDVTTITDTLKLAGIPSTDTILRSAISPSSSSSATACRNDGGGLTESLEASVRFGFPLNSWLDDLMNASVASDESVSFSLGDDVYSDEVTESDFLNGSANESAVLFTYGFWTMCQQFKCNTSWSNIYKVYKSVEASSAPDMLSNIQEIFTNSTQSTSSAYLWHNVSVPEVSVEFSTIDLSPQVTFESVTFDLPVKNDTMKYWLNFDTNETDWTAVLDTSSVCNDHACILKTPIQANLDQDQVSLLRLCMTQENSTDEDITAFTYPATSDDDIYTCRFPSNSSVIIYSFSQHIASEEVNIYVSSGLEKVSLKNPRRIYRVTVGRLSWKTTDLAKQYGATCSHDGQCNGLYFPLASETQHIVVGESYLPSPNTIIYPTYYTNWQTLAIAEAAISTTMQGDVIYPPNYNLAAGSMSWSDLSGYNCSYQGSDFLNDIMQRHIYSKDPLQPAYTAGLFWLFQDAAVKNIETKTAAGVRLSFDANLEWISPRVSIPTASAIISVAGCALIILAGFSVTYWSSNAQRQLALSNQLSAQNVASIRVDTKNFPTMLVHASVQDSKLRHQGVTDLQDFVVAEMTLRHQTNESVVDVTLSSKN